MLLAINTCLRRVEVALIDEGNASAAEPKIISEFSEVSHRNHTEKIFEFLEKILKNKQVNYDEVNQSAILNPDKVLVVSGPGAFTSIRVGVVTANTIAFASTAQMYAIDLGVLFEQESAQAGRQKLPVFISAGKSEIYEIHGTDNFIKNDVSEFMEDYSHEFFGDLNEWHLDELKKLGKEKLWNQRTLTFGQAVLKLVKNEELEQYALEKGGQALPTYLKPPNISISKKEI